MTDFTVWDGFNKKVGMVINSPELILKLSRVRFGGAEDALKDLRENILKGKKMKTVQSSPGDSDVAVVE